MTHQSPAAAPPPARLPEHGSAPSPGVMLTVHIDNRTPSSRIDTPVARPCLAAWARTRQDIRECHAVCLGEPLEFGSRGVEHPINDTGIDRVYSAVPPQELARSTRRPATNVSICHRTWYRPFLDVIAFSTSRAS